MKPRSIFVAIAFAGVALCGSREARATQEFPGLIQSTLSLSATPPCTICHRDDNGGLGTVVKPFGIYMQSVGLQPYNDGSLATALQALQGEASAGVQPQAQYLAALKAGTDPNADVAGPNDSPQYGCGALQIARRTSNGVGFSVALVAAAWLLRRRVRGRFESNVRA
jgi:hypothetical protein